ncbi:MAG: helix-turn-helix domain-containing protein [Phycisphaerae bacterium]|nr:helix-turn-helix domain-containing protein [Phycisphaerae bacterium]
MNIDYNFGAIRKLRKSANFSQEEFADKCQFSAQSLVSIEHDQVVPSLVNLRKIANALNISLEHLIASVIKRQPRIIKPDIYYNDKDYHNRILIYASVDMYIFTFRSDEPFYGHISEMMPVVEVGYYVISGESKLMVNNDYYDLKSGDAVFYDAAGRAVYDRTVPGDSLFIVRPKCNPIAQYIFNILNRTDIMDPDIAKSSNPKNNISFSAVRTLRKCRNKTIKDLADDSGLSGPTLTAIEKNGSNPTLSTIYKIARALNVSFIDLINLSEVQETKYFNKNLCKTAGVPGYDSVSHDQEVRIYHRTPEKDFISEPVNKESHSGVLTEYAIAVRGSLEVEVDGVNFKVQEGEAIVFDVISDHRYKYSPESEIVIVQTM